MISATLSINFLPQLNVGLPGVQFGESSDPESRGNHGVRDSVHVSPEGREKASETQNPSPSTSTGPNTELSAEEQRQVDELKQRDQEVKAHEQAHMAAGGGIVQGGATYEYERGPDGQMYAVGGEVKIDSSPEADPAATIRKMAQVRRAALAPMDPSSTDRSVAAKAYQMENQARAELARQPQEDPASESPTAEGEPASTPSTRPDFNPGNMPQRAEQNIVNILV